MGYASGTGSPLSSAQSRATQSLSKGAIRPEEAAALVPYEKRARSTLREESTVANRGTPRKLLLATVNYSCEAISCPSSTSAQGFLVLRDPPRFLEAVSRLPARTPGASQRSTCKAVGGYHP